jgi:recombination protein RecA
MYNEGISKVGGILDLGVEAGLVEKRGSFYTYGEGRIGQGRENAKQYLRENPDLAQELAREILAHAGLISGIGAGISPNGHDEGEEAQPAGQSEDLEA